MVLSLPLIAIVTDDLTRFVNACLNLTILECTIDEGRFVSLSVTVIQA